MLCAYHQRDPEVDINRLKALDQNAYWAELLAERGGDEWTQLVALAKNLEALKVAEQKEIEAGTPTTPPSKKGSATKEESAKIIRQAGGASKRAKKRAAAQK